MNNSFIFSAPTSQATPPAVSPDFKSARKADAPAQPFSNVLDRAVQTPQRQQSQKAKNDSMTEGCRAEQRSERPIEVSEEHKPSMSSRGSRRKEKNEDDAATQQAVCAGMSGPIVKPQEPVSDSGTSDTLVEGDIKVEICSSPSSSADEMAGENVVAETTNVEASTVDSAEADPQLNKILVSGEGSIEKNLGADLKPVEQTQIQETSQTAKNLSPAAEQTPTIGNEELSPKKVTSAVPSTQATATSVIPASTAREVAIGVLSATPALDTAAEILPPTSPEEIITANEIVPDEIRRSTRATRRAWDEMPENTHGTAGAKTTVSMINEAKREEIAGLTQQLLPVGAVAQFASGINLPSESVRHSNGEIIGVDALSAAARLATGPTRTDVSVNTELLELRNASPTARLGEVISREVRMFKRGGDDLVEVVLTPDAKTQISLKIQWRDGQVEVQARCDMGDHGMLNTQWPQLQASFAAHGVRLSHLSERAQTGFTEFFNNSGFSQQRGNEQQPAPQQSAIDAMKPIVPTPKNGAARSVVRASNRLESWA